MEKILSISLVLMFIFVSPVYAESGIETLKIPLQKSVISLDPAHVQDVPSLFVSRQINCQLVRNQGSVFNLDAAESIKYMSPLVIMIKIKSDKKFHDGSPVRAYDVAASFEYVRKSRTVMRNIFYWVKHITIKDDKTIIFYLKKPIPQFLKVLSSPNYAIFKKSFLDLVSKENALWKNPLSCGGYRIAASDDNTIELLPVNSGMPVTFYLSTQNQVSVEEMKKYDIVSLSIVGDASKIHEFNTIEIFDPLQVFIGLNLKKPAWKNLSSRCVFLSKIKIDELLKGYGSSANAANDLLPQGTLGYDSSESFLSKIKIKYQNQSIPKLNTFCMSYLAVSIPEKYRENYIKMIKAIYPNVTTTSIKDTKQFGLKFSSQKCDALVFALKSNYLDAYEYLDVFENNDANFSGIYDKNLSDEINNSQNLNNSYERAKTYREIINKIENACVIKPLITIPMRIIYVRKSLITPGIGLGPLNEYYLGNIRN